MRNFGQFFRKCVAALVLIVASACFTFAGVMQYPGDNAPSQTNSDIQHTVPAPESVTTYGDIPYPGATVDPVTEVVLSLLQGAMLLF